jgi:hypothetical protein
MNDPEQLKHNITEEALKNGTKVSYLLKTLFLCADSVAAI